MSGVCTRLATDPNNCGACGRHCEQLPNVVTTCSTGVCAYTCAAGWADCDGLLCWLAVEVLDGAAKWSDVDGPAVVAVVMGGEGDRQSSEDGNDLRLNAHSELLSSGPLLFDARLSPQALGV